MQFGTHGQGVVRIDGAVAFLDVLNQTIFVDDDIGALRPFVGLILLVVSLEDSVGGEHFLIHVAQEGKFDADLFGEGGIGCGRIDANSKNFGI